ncbi:MAG TPA: helix-turn-helix transcriptional regulator [Candidatus Dormibacteraeota bacterium]|jgi:DNA-binding PadR family transcriptional regulator|nr:helix-turn-helix transcriptional regulator [Candidatus Dormibacteraeota bacterium]
MRSSIATLQVLRTFFDDPASARYGVELMASSGLKAGTLYPILNRLELDGWILGRWEDIDESAAGRRRRRYYRLTGAGERQARALLTQYATLLMPPPRPGESAEVIGRAREAVSLGRRGS